MSTLKEDVKELKGSSKAQIWTAVTSPALRGQGRHLTLIGILGTAVIGTVIRFVITAYPGGNPYAIAQMGRGQVLIYIRLFQF
ncbi:hypothetical protein CY0110_04923 [Crocosphaera chwakensis CCY0110]|uniref:Uncharacterized protein n=1 Tax=Crocosphaera chwakensis CCY0110 TaxID=391612 RepID=A3IT77_9CHRO|nr:hypothetical protein CY0110_04923 [Crocosphaera chwakensis CCY0110]